MLCRNFSGAQLQWEAVATSTSRSQTATQQQQQQNHANHSQSKTSRVHTDDQSEVKLVQLSLLSKSHVSDLVAVLHSEVRRFFASVVHLKNICYARMQRGNAFGRVCLCLCVSMYFSCSNF